MYVLLVVTPIIKSMASNRVYSPKSRLATLKRYINAQTPYTATSAFSYVTVLRITDSDKCNLGYILYDTDMNTATSFIFEAREFDDKVVEIQKFKALFPTCIRLFRIGRYTYYRIDAVHGK